MNAEDTLTTWTTDLLSNDPDLFLVNIYISSGKGAKKVVIHIDGDQGVPIDTCAQISRALSQRLEEEEDVMAGAYTLEVSSPGLSQPLRLKRQYTKNVGRSVKVLLEDDRVVQGKLLTVDDTQITVAAEANPRAKKKVATKETVVPFGHIKETHVLPTFH